MTDVTQIPAPQDEDIQFSDVPTDPHPPGGHFFDYDPNQTTPEQYDSRSWPSVIAQGMENFAPSTARAAMALPKALYQDPIGTLELPGKAIVGAGSKMLTALGYPMPNIQDNEKYINSMIDPFTSEDKLKKTIAEDPVSVASTAAIPFTMGDSAAGKVASSLGEDASMAAKAGSVLKNVALAAANPADVAIATAGGARRMFGNFLNTVGSASTGISKPSLEAIYRASQMGDAGVPYANEFSDVVSGKVGDADIATRMRRAADAASKDTSAQWLADSNNVMAANEQIDYTPVIDAINAQKKKYYSAPLPGGGFSPMAQNYVEANNALGYATTMVQNVARDTTPGVSDLEKFNSLKQTLYDLAEEQANPKAKQAVMGVWQGVHDQLFKTSPEYSNLMDSYQDYLQGKTDLAKGLGLGQNTQSGTTLNKAIKGQDKPFQQSLLQTIYGKDPGLEYAIAGADVRNAIASQPSLRSRLIEGALGAGSVATAYAGHPFIGMGMGAVSAGNELLHWPKILTSGNKTAGAASRVAGPVSDVTARTLKAAAPVAINNQRTQEPDIQFSDQPTFSPDQIPTGQASGGRVERKSGGRTKTNAISAEVVRVRNALRDKTQNMLSIPDDAIATALQMAKG